MIQLPAASFTKLAALAFVPLPITWSGVNADVPALPKGDAFVDYFQTAWLDGNDENVELSLSGMPTHKQSLGRMA